MQRIRHVVRLALKSLAVHRLRSSLAILGIVLGVASVIVMLGVGEAARYEAIRQIQELGATNIILRSVKPPEDNKMKRNDEILTYGLTGRDLERLTTTVPTLVSATPLREFRKDVRHRENKVEGRVVGVMPNYLGLN